MDENAFLMEVTVYSCGDSRDVATWSNVPYLFCQAMERQGVTVNRVNIEPNRVLNRWMNRASFLIYQRLLGKRQCPIFARTWLHRAIIDRRLKRAAKSYPNSELNIFLSYGFVNKHSDKPSVLWCDWTDRVVIERLGRQPQWYERASLRHEDEVMRMADRVYTMFPVCKRHMEGLYGREIVHLGVNVINSLYDGRYDPELGADAHYKSNKILFIGNIRYHSGAKQLIEAISKIREQHPELSVDIIGMTEEQIGETAKHDWVRCHGYLRKDDAEQRDKYYRLMLDARLFINPTQGWGGYSSTVEAMFYGCPVIVAPYEDFVEEMGKEINFGAYYDAVHDSLENRIEEIITLCREEYTYMSLAAHDRVKDYTWDNYMSLLLEDLKIKVL